MSVVQFFPTGIKYIQDAAAADQRREYQRALQLYERGLTYLITGLKYEKNSKTKEIVRSRALEYMARAEFLKNALAEIAVADAPKAAAAAPAAKAPVRRKRAASEPADADRDKMRNSLEDAIVSEKPDVKWSDVAGLDDAKAAIEEAVIMPQKFPRLFEKGTKRTPWKAILLYGPPGTGKSFLAKATASMTDATFVSVSSADLISKWQGESERTIRQLFQLAGDRRPAIIFIDEIDSIAGKRSEDEQDATRRMKNELLIRLQEVADMEGVMVLAATNRPWDLDPAVRRRFDKRIYIPLPTPELREKMLRNGMAAEAHDLRAEDWHTLADRTEGFSGSDLEVVVKDALLAPVRHAMHATHFRRVLIDGAPKLVACPPDAPGAFPMSLMSAPDPTLVAVPPIHMGDFEEALDHVKPSVSADDHARFEEWTRQFGTLAPAAAPPEAGPAAAEDVAAAPLFDDDDMVVVGGPLAFPGGTALPPPPSVDPSRKPPPAAAKRPKRPARQLAPG